MVCVNIVIFSLHWIVFSVWTLDRTVLQHLRPSVSIHLCFFDLSSMDDVSKTPKLGHGSDSALAFIVSLSFFFFCILFHRLISWCRPPLINLKIYKNKRYVWGVYRPHFLGNFCKQNHWKMGGGAGVKFRVFLWRGSVNYGHYLLPGAALWGVCRAMSSVSRPFGAKICPLVLHFKQRGNHGAPTYY